MSSPREAPTLNRKDKRFNKKKNMYIKKYRKLKSKLKAGVEAMATSLSVANLHEGSQKTFGANYAVGRKQIINEQKEALNDQLEDTLCRAAT